MSFDDADHLVLVAVHETAAQRPDAGDRRLDSFADRALIRPGLPRHRFVDHDDRHRLRVVLRRESDVRATSGTRRSEKYPSSAM